VSTSPLYFRQLLSGRDFAVGDPLASQMVNFVYAVGDRRTGECVLVDPAYAVKELIDLVGADGMTVNGVLATQDRQLRQAVIRSGYDLGPEDTNVGASPKQRWIIILSLLVCVVGIVNAQLMAVTERFREIGTMKCLGALDRFILRLFILEAGMQGLVGAGAGALAGAVFALISGVFRFGFAALTSISWISVIVSVFMALGVGCLLSLLGVLYPALIAARMQPVEAMRVEQ